MEWTFSCAKQSTSVVIENDGKDVLFHPRYSTGTAAVRGVQPLAPNMHHYWEVRMESTLYGTDVSVGVGTQNACYDSHESSFVKLLGKDRYSWGYSYVGQLQHNNENIAESEAKLVSYTKQKWAYGSVVGVYLNRWQGTLAFYLDRQLLGIAFRDLPKTEELYPMLSSTAAKSKMSLTCAQSYPCNLAFECVKIINDICTANIKGKANFNSSETACRRSLILKNNRALLLKIERNTDMSIATLNNSWISQMPPGIKYFIEKHCWYIIGRCPFKIKDDQHLDKMECYENSAKSCDIDLTDDEIEDSKKNLVDFDRSMNINVEETCDETHKSSSFSKNTQSKGGKCQRNSSILISSSLRCETRSKKYRTRNGDDAIKGEKSYAPSQSSKDIQIHTEDSSDDEDAHSFFGTVKDRKTDKDGIDTKDSDDDSSQLKVGISINQDDRKSYNSETSTSTEWESTDNRLSSSPSERIQLSSNKHSSKFIVGKSKRMKRFLMPKTKQ